jgi:hypothetical protein
MSKSPRIRIIFKPKRIAEGDWQIEAHGPGAEIRYIKGLRARPILTNGCRAAAA